MNNKTLRNAIDTVTRSVQATARTVLCAAMLASPLSCLAQPYVTHWIPTSPGISYGFAADVTRASGSFDPYQDFTVAAQLTARNDRGIDQWAFGVAAEAWALPGSRSILVGAEAAVINEEPSNLRAKVAINAVFKNRRDGGPDPGDAMNANSIAYWITAQPGTGFQRGLVFDRGSLFTGEARRPAAIDLSDLTDEEVGHIDLIRIRHNVALRYNPVTRQLTLVTNGR